MIRFWLCLICGLLLPTLALTAAPPAATPPDEASTSTAHGELHDITGIERLPPLPPAPRWPWWLAGAAVLLTGVFLVVRVLRRRRRPVPLPPPEAALAELERLARQVDDPGTDGLYQAAVATVLRRYVSLQLHVAETGRTSEELLNALRSSGNCAEPPQRLLADILTDCDLAKFAKAGLDTAQRRHLVTQAREFIEATRSPSVPSLTPRPKDG